MRRGPLALGVALAVVGLAALVVPGLTAALPFDRFVVLLLGGLLAVAGVQTFRRRWATPRTYAEFPEVEGAVALPTPGEEFDERLAAIGLARVRRAERDRVQREIAAVAVETIRRRHGVSTAEAESMLAEGTWTDDPYAAAFFTGEPPAVSRVERVRETIGARSRFHHRARRAVAATVALLEGDDE